jgi:uncharacterized protein YndB with AHSA1/START domain
VTNDARADASGSISIVRDFDAPRELVFRDWIDPEEVATWFAPDGFTVTLCEVDGRRAGSWRVEYESESGERYLEYGVFHEVRPPEELVFTLKQESGTGRIGPTTLVTVQFADIGGKTRMSFVQTGLTSTVMRDDHVEGWSECFHKLARRLVRQ